MRKIIKRLAFIFAYYSGFNWLRGKFLKKKVFCVGYHSISAEANKSQLRTNIYPDISIPAGDFNKQILFLKKNGHSFIHFSDLNNSDTQKLEKPTIIYFDDGFKDVLLNALPILEKYGVPATVFATTGLIGRTSFVWTSGLRSFLVKKGTDPAAIEKTILELKKLPAKERDIKLKELYAANNFTLDPRSFNIYLDWNELSELGKRGFEIGSHGVSHKKFTELEISALREELAGSKKIIEEKTGRKVSALSYPHGRYNAAVKKEAEVAGYEFAVCTEKGVNDFGDLLGNRFALKRVAPEPNESINAFKVRIYTFL